jgi:N-acetylmuramoyl-L-alanine amidase
MLLEMQGVIFFLKENKLKKRAWIIILLPRKIIGYSFLSLTLILLLIFFTRPYDYLSVSQAKVLNEITVVIDPGHGGIDGGVSRGDDLLEKDVNLEIAKSLRTLLVKKGCSVKMTRETDTDVSHLIPGGPETRHRRDVHSRAKYINESNGDLFISLHVNSCDDPYTRGAITFYAAHNEESLILAEIIQSYLNLVTETDPGSGEYYHKGINAGDLYILNNAVIPGVLVEVGFITNVNEKKLLGTREYRKRLAEAICNGIIAFITSSSDSVP